MQTSTSGASSNQLWVTLRRAFQMMVSFPQFKSFGLIERYLTQDRPDLAELAKPDARTNLEVFRNEGFDFQT
jgi:peroxin-5